MEFSRTHFEVLGLGFEGQGLGFGLEASSLRKLPRPKTALFLESLKFCWKTPETLPKICEDIFFCWRSPEKTFRRPLFSFWEHLRLVSLVLGLGLEHSCPWPEKRLSSRSRSFAFASDFFCVLGLGLEPWSSTPPQIISRHLDFS